MSSRLIENQKLQKISEIREEQDVNTFSKILSKNGPETKKLIKKNTGYDCIKSCLAHSVLPTFATFSSSKSLIEKGIEPNFCCASWKKSREAFNFRL